MEDQIRIEYEITQLKSNNLGIGIISKQKKEYQIDIIIPHSIIDPSIYNEDITFVLIINSDNFPYNPPKLLCTTQYCFPQYSDGRDILEEVIGERWNENIKLVNLLPLIPDFIKKVFMDGNLIYIGKYYLGGKYDLKLLERSNYEIKQVKENILINGKWVKFLRLMLISDIYFLLFEIEKWNKNKLTLVFWSSINSIKSIKKILVNNMVFIHWSQKGINEPYEMFLTMDKGEETVDKLLEKIHYFGLNYNITKEIKGNKIEEKKDEEVNKKNVDVSEKKNDKNINENNKSKDLEKGNVNIVEEKKDIENNEKKNDEIKIEEKKIKEPKIEEKKDEEKKKEEDNKVEEPKVEEKKEEEKKKEEPKIEEPKKEEEKKKEEQPKIEEPKKEEEKKEEEKKVEEPKEEEKKVEEPKVEEKKEEEKKEEEKKEEEKKEEESKVEEKKEEEKKEEINITELETQAEKLEKEFEENKENEEVKNKLEELYNKMMEYYQKNDPSKTTELLMKQSSLEE